MSNRGDSAKLKGLMSRRSSLEIDLSELKETRKRVQEDIHKTAGVIKNITKDIESLTRRKPVVSEHAMLRYLDRVMGIDMEILKSIILSEDVLSGIKNLGNGKYPVDKGIRAVVRDNVVVTVEVSK